MVDLVTLEQVRDWLKPGSGALGTGDDALLGRLIASASQMVLGHVNRDGFAVQSFTEYYDTAAVNFLSLRQSPVVAVQSLQIENGTPITMMADPVSPRPNQLLLDRQRLIVVGGKFPAGRGTVRVVYTAGYSTVPDDVKQVVIELVAERYKTRDRIGVSSKNLPNGESVSFSRNMLSPLAIQVLAPYVRVI